MRSWLLAFAILGAVPSVADPLFERCEGDPDCIAAMKRADKAAKAQPAQSAVNYKEAAARQVLRESMGIGFDYHLTTDAEWDAWFKSDVGRKFIADTIARADATYRRAMNSQVYYHTFQAGGTTTTCSTVLHGSSATTDCR